MAGSKQEISPDDLSFGGRGKTSTSHQLKSGTLHEKIEALERREIKAALEKCNNNRTHTAQALGLSRQGLLKKIERYGLA